MLQQLTLPTARHSVMKVREREKMMSEGSYL